MDDFEAAWRLYPRKVAKHPARLEWAKLDGLDRFTILEALPVHIKYWQLAGYGPEFIPHFRTWLYQRRWEDELAMPEATSGNAWMKSESGIATKAAQVGVQARPGEGYQELRARILAKERG